MDDRGMTAPEADSAHRRPRRWRAVSLMIATAALILLADQGTKHLALRTLEDREAVRLLGGAVYLTVTRNSGAAFSLGSDYTFVFPVVTIVVVGWIAVLAWRLRSLPWAVSLGLVLGGALGNLSDRIFRAPGPFTGHVIDMVSVFDDNGEVFPVFNVADSSLIIGVCLAILLELTGRQRDGTRLPGRDRKGSDAAAVDGGPDTAAERVDSVAGDLPDRA